MSKATFLREGVKHILWAFPNAYNQLEPNLTVSTVVGSKVTKTVFAETNVERLIYRPRLDLYYLVLLIGL